MHDWNWSYPACMRSLITQEWNCSISYIVHWKIMLSKNSVRKNINIPELWNQGLVLSIKFSKKFLGICTKFLDFLKVLISKYHKNPLISCTKMCQKICQIFHVKLVNSNSEDFFESLLTVQIFWQEIWEIWCSWMDKILSIFSKEFW